MEENKKITTSPLQGFMELLPEDQIVFNNIKDVIEGVYKKYGFLNMDTPIIERSEVLLAKAGGETEKQIYRFNKGDGDLSLRFDLTVPLSRYIADNFHNINFPFKRYAIGKVFRGERAQRGRFREFYQADIDIINKDNLSIINDVEIISVVYDIFKTLDFGKFTIRINNRKILTGFLKELKLENKSKDILILIDKIEKIDKIEFLKELNKIVNDKTKEEKIYDFINVKGKNEEKIKSLVKFGIKNEEFNIGLEEMKAVLKYAKDFNIDEKYISFDLSIVRGLDYYTGTVYETMLDDYRNIGSICSGGRYDDLMSLYTKEKFKGVGISIGLTRLFDQLKNNGLLEKFILLTEKNNVLIINMTENYDYVLNIAKELRENNINTEIYFENGKMGKKLEYADKKNVPYVLIIGENEVKDNVVMFKDMKKKEQEVLKIKEVIKKIKK